MTDLHVHPPMTMERVHARIGWVLPIAAMVFSLLAVGAAFGSLPWDGPITHAAISARNPAIDDLMLTISRFGSTPVVLAVAGLAALVAWPRCPRLAAAIVVLALARPLVEFGLKELVGRERPIGDRMVAGRGPSFPSGHPFAVVASWGLIPLVVALYTKRRIVWWAVSCSVWTLAVLVAVSRVWLGVHWTSDVVASLLLAVLSVAGAEWFIKRTHAGGTCAEALRQATVATVDEAAPDRVPVPA